jgi:hypothetical protein
MASYRPCNAGIDQVRRDLVEIKLRVLRGKCGDLSDSLKKISINSIAYSLNWWGRGNRTYRKWG